MSPSATLEAPTGFVPYSLFGKDHWSQLMYCESCAVDKGAHGSGGESTRGVSSEGLREITKNSEAIFGIELMIGSVDHRRMRANHLTHPLLQMNGFPWEDKNGTKLKDYFVGWDKERPTLEQQEERFGKPGQHLPHHDDWDCVDDLEACGLLESISLVNGVIGVTPLGLRVAHELRQHQARGGGCSTFELSSESREAMDKFIAVNQA